MDTCHQNYANDVSERSHLFNLHLSSWRSGLALSLVVAATLVASSAFAKDNERSLHRHSGGSASTSAAASDVALSPATASAAASLGLVVSHPASVVPASTFSSMVSDLVVDDEVVTTRPAPGLSPDKEMAQ